MTKKKCKQNVQLKNVNKPGPTNAEKKRKKKQCIHTKKDNWAKGKKKNTSKQFINCKTQQSKQ